VGHEREGVEDDDLVSIPREMVGDHLAGGEGDLPLARGSTHENAYPDFHRFGS
jgi:hypothetical protein